MKRNRQKVEILRDMLDIISLGSIRVHALTTKVNFTHLGVTNYLIVLVEKGYVNKEKIKDERNYNRNLFYLTGNGMALLQELNDLNVKYGWINEL